jgi:type I restriction-modification system DNA methylase subunit
VKGDEKMKTPTKTLKFDDDVMDVLKDIDVRPLNGNFIGYIQSGQLDRDLYVRVNKALEALGGKWDRKSRGHIFSVDPSERLAGMVDTNALVVERDGFFETPRHVTEMMLERIGTPLGGKILEPSAGIGAIADVLIEYGVSRSSIVCVERNEQRANILSGKGYSVFCEDFLEFRPTDSFDHIFMNPPFEIGQDIEHVLHAFDLLSEEGKLASVMSEGVFFRPDRKAVVFREWLDSVGESVKLPPGTFKESGTGVKTRLIFATKTVEHLGSNQPRLFY